MEEYLRTDSDGNQVLDITLLDEDTRARFLDDVKRWAGTLLVEPGDLPVSEDQRRASIYNAVAAALNSFTLPGDGVRITRKTEVWMYEAMCEALEAKYPI